MYSNDQVNKLKHGLTDCMRASERLHMQGHDFFYKLRNERAKEFMLHGFLRRSATLSRCIENIYRLCPPGRTDKLTPDNRKDLEINLQAFVFNVFGALDNLALVTVHELGIKIAPGRVGFLKEEIDEMLLNGLSKGFRRYITSKKISEWKSYMRDFRHALGHRIPFYVPPAVLNEAELNRYREIENELAEAMGRFDLKAYERLSDEQASLGKNFPVITHSISERSKQVFFHSQVLADFNTVVEIATKFMNWFGAFESRPASNMKRKA
jgi:hypothetical protein